MRILKRKIAWFLCLVFVLESAFSAFAGTYDSVPDSSEEWFAEYIKDFPQKTDFSDQYDTLLGASSAAPIPYEGEIPTDASQYLTFKGNDSFTITTGEKGWNKDLIYSTNKTEWYYLGGNATISSDPDSAQTSDSPHEIYICGIGNNVITGAMNIYYAWSIDGDATSVACSGYIETLLDFELAASDPQSLSMGDYCFCNLFYGCSKLSKAPSFCKEKLTPLCYAFLFQDCTSLTDAPYLPATQLAYGCYGSMFQGCTSLVTVPESLPAMSLAQSCYAAMFYGCLSLRHCPKLPAKTLAPQCYFQMFSRCEELDTPPILCTEKLAGRCYYSMFSYCTKLKIDTATSSEAKKSLQWSIISSDQHPEDADGWNENMFEGSGTSLTPELNKTYYVNGARRELTWDAVEGTFQDGTHRKTEFYPYGDTPTILSEVPTRESVEWSYAFDHWDGIPEELDEDTTCTAVYRQEKHGYTVPVQSSNTSWGKVSTPSVVADYGSAITVSETSANEISFSRLGQTYTVTATPKAADEEYLYVFTGWTILEATVDDTPEAVTANFDRIPLYSVSLAITEGQESWGSLSRTDAIIAKKDTVISSEGNQLTVGTGTDAITVTATPATDASGQYVYTFAGWSGIESPLTKNITVTASFEQHVKSDYTVTWKNYNGAILETDVNVAYGTTPSYDGATPVKPATAEHTYVFSGWDPAVTPVTGDITYTAVFTENPTLFTVTWKNYDGTVLETDENVAYGTTPSYDGATPVKPATAEHTYVFSGWNPAVTPVTGDATYTATFTEASTLFTVTWKNYDDTVLETDENVPYGTTPSYDGAAPTRPQDAEYTYSFTGWTPEIAPVTADVCYTAAYSSTKRSYTVSFDANGHGVAPASITVTWGEKLPTQADPQAEGYTFMGWYLGADYTKDTRWDFETMTMPANDLKLYAGWKENKKPTPTPDPDPEPSHSSTTKSSTVVSYSDCLITDQNGNWLVINKKTGLAVANAWVCDDAASGNGNSIWYLTDGNGYLVAAPLLRDASGRYFSMETSHNGSYGCMRHVNGTYDGIYMEFSQNHDGSYGAITNQSAIDALNAAYGAMQFGFGNEACTFTSTFYN